MNYRLNCMFLIALTYQCILFAAVGALDTTFGTSSSGKVTTTIGISGSNLAAGCALQQDNKIVVVGDANPGFGVARYTQLGVLDTTFNSGGSIPGTVRTTAMGSSALATGVAIQSDGKIVVCGTANNSSGIALARYLPNGLLDTTFNTTGYVVTAIPSGGNHRCYDIIIDNSGNIIICGSVTISTQKILIARYTSAGELDTSFNTNGYIITSIGSEAQLATGLTFDSSGNILVSGTIVISSLQQFIVLCYTPAGLLDTNFNSTGYVITTLSGGSAQAAYAIITDSANNIVVCGKATTSSSQKLAVLRYTPDGILDTDFGISGVTLTTLATSPSGYRIALQSNGSIIVGGNTINSIFVARYTSAGVLDTTAFNATTGYNTIDLTTPGIPGLILQPNNGIVISALSAGAFTTARFVGDAAPQGCIDVTYNTAGVNPGYITYPTDATAANKPQIKSLQAMANNKIYLLTEDTGTVKKSQLVQLNANGTNSLTAVDISPIGAADVIVDSQQRALAIGTSGGAGWLRRSTSSTSLAADSTFGTSGFVTETAQSSSFRRVGEQKQGRILVIGQAPTTSRGLLIAYNEFGVLASNAQNVCAPFGNNAGFRTFSNATYYDMLIDSNDGIYILHKNPSGIIQVFKLLPDGSANDTTFGTSGTVDTGWLNSSYRTPSMTFDANGNIVVAAVNISNNGIEIQRFTPTSTTTTTSSIPQTSSLLTTPILTRLQCDTNNRLFFNGYDANVFFVARCGAGTIATLDTTFAPYSSSPGILKTMYNDNNPTDTTTPKRVSNGVCISPNGTILFGGYENIASTTTISTLGNVVGDTTPYSQVARYPGAMTGAINTDFGTNGALSLAAAPASLPAGTAQPMYVLPNNKILVTDTNGTDTVLGQLTSAYALDTSSFGGGTGKVTLPGLVNPVDMMIDTANNMYVVGDNGSNAMVFKITSAGVIVWSKINTSMTLGNVVCQQASGRILVGGYTGSSGVITGYNPTTGDIDTTFAASGYYITTINSRIVSMAVTTADAIVFTYRTSSATASVYRLLSNGTVDTTFTFGTALTGMSNTVNNQSQVRLQVDVNGKIILFGRTTTGDFKGSRYLATGADDVGPVTLSLTNPSTSACKDLLALSNGTTLALGLNTNGNTVQIARLTSAFAVDTTFSNTSGLLQTAVSPMTGFNSLDVTADQKILVAGASATPNPYFTQVYNNAIVTKVNQSTTALGAPGVINTSFGTLGEVLLASLSGATALVGLTPQVLLTAASGQYYIGFTNGSLIRLTNAPVLDTTFDSDGFASPTQAGIESLIIDGSNRLLATGTTGGAGWINRYNAGLGSLDSSFNTASSTALSLANCTAAHVVAQQTLGRNIIAGTLSSGNGAIFALTNTGTIDTTFTSGVTPGVYNTGVSAGIYALAVDQFDRLLIAYKNGTAIDVVRLTSAGQLDTQFNATGIFATALTNASDAAQVRIVVDSAGNIIVAASTSSGISLRGLTTTGTSLYAQLNISTIITNTPVLSNLVATSDGNVVCNGYQTTTNPMWVARVTSAGVLDTTFGGGDGIMTFSFDGTATARFLSGMAIYGDGEIVVVGTETVSSVITPFISMAYNTPYITQVSQTPDSKPVGTNDITLGASTTAANALGVVFFATATAAANSAQVARAVALQDAAHMLVAVDGGASAGSATPSNMYLTMFNIDGVPDTTFGTNGQQTVMTTYANQYVHDMLTFTTITGVHKAILAGYTYNSALPISQQYNSLLLQYNLDTHAIDSNFGGYNGNPVGIACGDGQKIFSLGQQSIGRIIATGLSKDNKGLLLGYTASGKLDFSFGNNGYQSIDTGTTGLYSHAIDTQNRIVCTYNNGSGIVQVVRFLPDGSGLDTTFTAATQLTTGLSNIDMKVAVDSSNNVLVAAVESNGRTIDVTSYNGISGTQIATRSLSFSSLGGSSSSVYTLARLLVDTLGNVVVVAYDSHAKKNLIIRLTGALVLDTANFNTPLGYLLYAVGVGVTSQVTTDALIHPDGRIVIVGSQA